MKTVRVIPPKQRLQLVQGFRQMVAQLAWRAWRRLPVQTQAWIGVDDMIEDGMWEAYLAILRFKPARAELSTFLYHNMKNFYQSRYLEKFGVVGNGNGTRITGRYEALGISLEAMVGSLQSTDGRATVDDAIGLIPQLQVGIIPIEQNVLTECFVVPAMVEIYETGSRHLQQEMVHWFLQSRMKIHYGSLKFRHAAKEFRQLSRELDLHRDDCLHLMRSQKCLDMLNRRLLWVPYDLDNPAPGVDRQL